MPTQRQRLLFYLVLAVVSYAVAMGIGTGPASAVFLIGGVAAELSFWIAAFGYVRSRKQPSE